MTAITVESVREALEAVAKVTDYHQQQVLKLQHHGRVLIDLLQSTELEIGQAVVQVLLDAADEDRTPSKDEYNALIVEAVRAVIKKRGGIQPKNSSLV